MCLCGNERMLAAFTIDDSTTVHADADTKFQHRCGSSHLSRWPCRCPFYFILPNSSVKISLHFYFMGLKSDTGVLSSTQGRMGFCLCTLACVSLHCLACRQSSFLFWDFPISFCSYCFGHKGTAMWKTSLINSGNWADNLPSSLSLEEYKNNLLLASHLFVYTPSPLLYQFDTDLFQRYIYCLNTCEAHGQIESALCVGV